MRALPYADPGTPVLRSPWAFLRWVGRGQWVSLLWGIAFGVLWMVSQALIPATISRAIDDGIVAGDAAALTRGCSVLTGLARVTAGAGTLRHRMAVLNWMQAAFRGVQLVGWKAADTGPALTRTVPAGDVVATVASDAMRLGGLFDITARFSGAVISYAVVAVILLRSSRPLGLIVLIGVPILVALLGLLVRPLQRRQAAQREASGALIGLGADTVAGLRVLRGIGGESTYLQRYAVQSAAVRDSGFRVAGIQAALDSAQILLPGVFVLIVTWLGARFAIEGQITPGQLVAFYGYSAFLVLPLRTATEFVDRATRSVIAARKIIRVLEVERDDTVVAAQIREIAHAGDGPATPAPAQLALSDEVSGLQVGDGEFVAIVCADPEVATCLADRLGGFGVDAAALAGVRRHGIPLVTLPTAQVRSEILVSESDPRLFTGSLREQLDPWERHTDEQILAALATVSGADILEALPEGLDSEVQERGRSFSGGQRQRLALARALLAETPVLVLVEPTSAVDAHTEARVAAGVRGHRTGRTTVVVTVSPLVLDHADRVVRLDVAGRVAASGTHRDLLHADPAYRSIVIRGEAD